MQSFSVSGYLLPPDCLPPEYSKFVMIFGIVNILHFDCECYGEMAPNTRYPVNAINKEGINLAIHVVDQ
jgi:hypothetical protein